MNTESSQKEILSELISKILQLDLSEALAAVDTNKLLPALDAEIQQLEELKTPWSPNYENMIYCNNVEEVKAVVRRALCEKIIVRTAGSQHSTPDAVFAKEGQKCLNIKLEKDLRRITIIKEENGLLYVRVGAGCNLGVDPSDNKSTVENSFNLQIDKSGYALPILGGMSHQTIGGFMMTSSAGGSLAHSFGDVLKSIEFIDGTGTEQIFNDGDDEFFAAAVSMGLYGIVTYVTLALPKKYLVRGEEATVNFETSMISNADTFEYELCAQEYLHCVWFPQKRVERVLQFRGCKVSNNQDILPYKHLLKSRVMNYLAAGVFYAINKLQHESGDASIKIAAFLLNAINPIKSEEFCDHWYIALPNDDQALIDSVIRVQFTEIWIDIKHIHQVFSALKTLFDVDHLAGGNFGVELYGAKASKFWMSQSYDMNVIRIDPYWWEFNPTGNLQDFFTKYWDVLLTIPTARLHWGKHFPEFGKRFGNFTIGPDYVAKAYPKFKEWLIFRERFDPKQIFVTDYWRAHFGI